MSGRDTQFSVEIETSGWRFTASAATTLLDAAAQANLRLPSSCRNGTCRACMCRLRSGRVSYRIAWPGLSAEEKADGFILPCVAYAEEDLVIAAPGAVRLQAVPEDAAG